MPKNYFKVLLLSTCTTSAFAQLPFFTVEYLDINNIKASACVHGDLWVNPVNFTPACEFPKSSGKSANFISALWMSGYDDNNNLYVAAQTFRQKGNDYWPGPLYGDTISYEKSHSWAKIWKVNKTEINTFRNSSPHTVSNTPESILTWPAKNNLYAKGNTGDTLNITTEMAPFIDVNQDGNYNPLEGDYPAIKGDQALWWVFNDNGPEHTNTDGIPLKIEVHAMAYAYTRNTLIDNVIYYEYTFHNKSGKNYKEFRAGIWNDGDLGNHLNDYAGFDSARRLAYIYNSAAIDGIVAVHPNHYDSMIPVTGITLIETPGDGNIDKEPAGSFIRYLNNGSVYGNPQTASEYNFYLRYQLRNGSQIKNDFKGPGIPSYGTGNGPVTKYMFTGNPADSNKWSECSCHNEPGDRKIVLTTNDYNFKAGEKTKITFALVIADPGTNHACGNFDIKDILIVADTSWNNYIASNIPAIPNERRLVLYPNPAGNQINLVLPGTNAATEFLKIYDMRGSFIQADVKINGARLEINTGSLPAGIYHLIYQDDDIQFSGRFLKQ